MLTAVAHDPGPVTFEVKWISTAVWFDHNHLAWFYANIATTFSSVQLGLKKAVRCSRLGMYVGGAVQLILPCIRIEPDRPNLSTLGTKAASVFLRLKPQGYICRPYTSFS